MQQLDLAAPIGYNGRYGNGIWGGISVTKQTVPNQLYRGIIVSCQALPGEPLHGRGMMAAMAQAGVIKGDQVGRLNPQGTLTRAEMAVILHRGLTL